MGSPSHTSPMVSANNLEWFTCHVQSAGPGEDGTIWVNLTDIKGQFTEVWFTALHAIRQQALETALAALQSNLNCQIGLTGTDPGSQIYRIHAESA
jgi:hypothetical protein